MPTKLSGRDDTTMTEDTAADLCLESGVTLRNFAKLRCIGLAVTNYQGSPSLVDIDHARFARSRLVQHYPFWRHRPLGTFMALVCILPCHARRGCAEQGPLE